MAERHKAERVSAMLATLEEIIAFADEQDDHLLAAKLSHAKELLQTRHSQS